ncbi:type IV secretory system conjugative DNA transfer family protein (plasmid) [Clostridium tyrobutyricum]|uniref:Conjugation protein n=1 Tax=Clostridium tyrobutyricum DIVETGP TaxID=1408889 RepID=W6N5B4_CLOTY|nr:type IV secretory system conjugative DNA transfer family protein [Clostridium tyrobutyricum]AND86339.1 conjugation protein TraK [Clostridium tyrobutyricum]ANP70921.1 conjugal transfer protein [Clostridium tyrobutyricum]MBV4435677.1 type IV secretory system conjugative DNA transfer family protein [Clostridium tyrobutyricum]QNB68244.1 type IV secretory system conjugative DNA transfer family protein [Clostridium tyrobutyricum]CDL91215.1 conjugation protein [Clostridium tyrobutyricum DIVETGP]
MSNKVNSNGIVLGIKDGLALIQPTKSKLPNRNCFVVGGPGSFKTQSFVVTNVLNERECSIVATDPKGELYEMTAKVKEAQGYEVHVINFMDMVNSDHYNPFDYVRKDREATTVANTMVAAKNDPKHKDIWYNAQLSLLKALILYSIYEMPIVKRNMSGILDFLQEFDPEQDESGVSGLDEQFLKLSKSHPARRAYELGFKKSQEATRASIIISLLTTIGDYVDQEVADFTSNSDFFLNDVGRRKIALYVIIPVMDDTWEGLINLFFSQMFQELYSLGAENNSKLPQPVIFLLDEFPNLGRFDNYEKFLATCRGYGIACCTIIQNITQLQEKYGREQAESILGNCGVKLCLGNVNDTTAKYFSELAGKTTVKVQTSSKSTSKSSKNDSSSSSQNFSYTGRNLINADEILTMDENESILIITGKYPIRLKKAKQFELFPDITDTYRCNQSCYEREIAREVLEFREEKKAEYEEYIHSDEKQKEQKENEEKLHEAKTKKLDKSENQDIDVLKDIIKEKSMEQEDKDEDFEDIGDFDELEDREKELK